MMLSKLSIPIVSIRSLVFAPDFRRGPFIWMVVASPIFWIASERVEYNDIHYLVKKITGEMVSIFFIAVNWYEA